MIKKILPMKYISTKKRDFEIFYHEFESNKNVVFLEKCICTALEQVKRILEFKPKRALAFCMFYSVQDYQKAFDKTAPDNMLTLAYCDADLSLVTLFSPVINSQNADGERMTRHISHEITHAFIYEKTKSVLYSTKGINIDNWVSEGFAEIVASRVCNRPEIIKNYLFVAGKHKKIKNTKLNKYLNDFDSPMRQIAFAHSVKLVSDEVASGKLSDYFKNL